MIQRGGRRRQERSSASRGMDNENQLARDNFLATLAISAIKDLKDRKRGWEAGRNRGISRRYIFSENQSSGLSFVQILEHFGIDVKKAMARLEKYR
jgi:hypothetical protein